MIHRVSEVLVRRRLTESPAVALLGPRQCGKSTLAQQVLREHTDAVYLDLERPADIARLADPEAFFSAHAGRLVCLDEIQRAPDIFPVLRGVLDRGAHPGQVLMLGSASPPLLRQTSETLAGRVAFIELTPFVLPEVNLDNPDPDRIRRQLWLRGGFPRSYLAANDEASLAWRESFVRTFLERDIPQLGVKVDTTPLRRFLQMCAHLHGDLWNASKIGASLGLSHPTVRRYLDLFVGAFMMRELPALHGNGKKRLVKAPRVFIRDSGVLHALAAIEDFGALLGHPLYGSSWEGFVLEQATAALPRWEPHFYRTVAGAECDLVLVRGRRRLAIECKAATAPRVTQGFWSALDDLEPERAWVVAPVPAAFSLARDVQVVTPEVMVRELAAFS